MTELQAGQYWLGYKSDSCFDPCIRHITHVTPSWVDYYICAEHVHDSHDLSYGEVARILEITQSQLIDLEKAQMLVHMWGGDVHKLV